MYRKQITHWGVKMLLNHRSSVTLLSLVLAVVIAGCTVYSLNQFCTKDKEIKIPDLNGNWRLSTALGDDVSGIEIDPWRISNDTITAYDRDNKKSEFTVVFFKLKNKIFADMVGKSPANNSYWNLTVVPMHVLLSVEFTQDQLTLTPAAVEWFNQKDNKAVKKLKFSNYNGDLNCRVYYSSPAEWEEFISNNIETEPMFNQKQKFVLQRVR
jgi:hypothetical protein